MYISLDNQRSNTYNELENLIPVSTGIETSVRVERSVFIQYPKPYSHCEILANQSHESKYYKQVLAANYSYSQALCLEFCRLDLLNNRNKCVYESSSIRVPNIKYCKPDTNPKVAEDYEDWFDRDLEETNKLNDECLVQCPLECEKTVFDSYISTSEYPGLYTRIYNESLRERKMLVDDGGDLTNDLIQLKIYFSSMSFKRYREEQAVSFWQCLSNFGGNLGLFLGFFLMF